MAEKGCVEAPYWLRLCEWSGRADGRGPFGPSAGSDRLHGELLVATIDRLRELGLPTQEAIEAFRLLSCELEKRGSNLDDEVRRIMEQSPLDTDGVEKLASIAAWKRRTDRVTLFANLLAYNDEARYEALRECSIQWLVDLAEIYRLMDMLGLDREPLDRSVEQLRQALRRLLAEFGDMMLACYTGYFDDTAPAGLFQLGGTAMRGDDEAGMRRRAGFLGCVAAAPIRGTRSLSRFHVRGFAGLVR